MIDLTEASNLKLKIFLDGADLELVKQINSNQIIKGYTSNPSLMHKSGIKSYDDFIKNFLKLTSKPVSSSDSLNAVYLRS